MRGLVVDVPPQEVITKRTTLWWLLLTVPIFYEVMGPFNASLQRG